MLAKIAPRFVIKGVIQNSYYVNYMSIELNKQIFGDSAENFYMEDAKKYFQCNFYGFLAANSKPTEFVDQFEAEKYQQAVQQFAVYNNVREIYQKLNEFSLEVRELYKVVESANSSSNFFARSSDIDEVFEEDLSETLTRYQKLLEDLQPYPEWRNKVMDDIGKRFLMIHNNLAEGEHKQEIFEKLNRHDYFV